MNQNPQISEILSENERQAIQKCVENAIISKEKYPVNFNEFWYWLGYFRKQKALTFLHNNFIKKLDFLPDFLPAKTQNGRPQKLIKLTLDCAENFAKKSNTAKSNLVYDFILICKENFEKNNQNINSNQNVNLKSIITIKKTDTQFVVSARELYDFLEIKTFFTTWCLRMF
jgi:phage anti-repressor protein